MIKRVQLWSGPRNVSTALMYSFAQRDDCKVFDEPLYGYYLKNSNASCYHPDPIGVMKSMELVGERVVKQMMSDESSPVLFFKQMTHHLLDLDRSFMKDCINIILTRDPKEMLPSFVKDIPNPKMKDVGYAAHNDLINYFEENAISYVVLDSRRLLLDPQGVLEKLCDFIQIPFQNKMLKWKAGPRPEDGVWAKYWYQNVHRSSGFAPYQKKSEDVPAHLETLLNECLPIYESLRKKAL